MNKHLKNLMVGFLTLTALPGSFVIVLYLLSVLQFSYISFLVLTGLLLGTSYGVGSFINKE